MDSQTTENPRKRFLLRLFFVLLIPFLWLQFLFILKVEEPYPGFTMPLFGGVDGDGTIFRTVENRILFEFPDEEQEFTMEEFWGGMSESYRFHVMMRLMGPESPPEVHSDPGFREWLQNRGATLTGRRDAKRFKVEWTSVQMDVSAEQVVPQKSPMGKFEYEF